MHAFVCDGCGARLPDPMGAPFVRCAYCGLGVQVAAPPQPMAPPQQVAPPMPWPPPPPVPPAPAYNVNSFVYAYAFAPIALSVLGGLAAAIVQCTARPPTAATVTAPTIAPAAAPAIVPASAAGDPLGHGSSSSSSSRSAASPVLKPSAATYAATQSAVIRYEKMPSTTHAWISVAKAGSDGHSYLTYDYVATPTGALTFPLSGYTPGAYVARAYADSGYTLIAEVPFTIAATAPTARH